MLCHVVTIEQAAQFWDVDPGRLSGFRKLVWRRMTRARGHSSDGRAPALHAGGRRFDPAWLHHCGFMNRLLNNFFVRVSGFGISEMLLPGTRALIFNNMVVLSRASWVQDDSEHDCDDHANYRNEHKTVSARCRYQSSC